MSDRLLDGMSTTSGLLGTDYTRPINEELYLLQWLDMGTDRDPAKVMDGIFFCGEV